jgi:hypothetical protein
MRCLTVTLESSSAANATATETESKPKVEPTAHPPSVCRGAASGPIPARLATVLAAAPFVFCSSRNSSKYGSCDL